MRLAAIAEFAGIVATLVILPIGALAQNAPPASPLQPSPPHERMAFFEGTWVMEPDPYFKGRPAGTPSGVGEETCAWLPGGRRHMICRSWRERDGVRREAMYILSYRTQENVYIAHHAFPDGANLTYHSNRW